jgi:hypothetical protein
MPYRFHDESKTPFQKQLGWHPAPDDDSLIQADRIFIKHGYGELGVRLWKHHFKHTLKSSEL